MMPPHTAGLSEEISSSKSTRTVRGLRERITSIGFTLDVGLAAAAADGAQNFTPSGHHHFGADFARRRALGRDDGRHRDGLALGEKLVDLMIDRVFLLRF